jgi:spore maturation protein CgeB
VLHSIDIVFIGLAITSSWGNGHAVTYRSLLRGLHQRGHRILFLERDQPWYAPHRDAPQLECCDTQLYADVHDLRERFAERVRTADAVIVGSFVAEGREVCDWVLEQARGVRAFYDIDTPVTLSALRSDTCEYLRADQIPQFDLMLSFTGGPTLQRLEAAFGARRARPLYCSVNVEQYSPQLVPKSFALGYMGTYSHDRQGPLERLLNDTARRLPRSRFIVAGAQYPSHLHWPANVERTDHLPPHEHAAFYGRQQFTLNLTRADMRKAGYSPSVRLFEAAACGTPIISDPSPGLDEIFVPGAEILLARDSDEVVGYLEHLSAAAQRRIAAAARERVLGAHSSAHRAAELERYLLAARSDAAHAAVRGNTLRPAAATR